MIKDPLQKVRNRILDAEILKQVKGATIVFVTPKEFESIRQRLKEKEPKKLFTSEAIHAQGFEHCLYHGAWCVVTEDI